MTSTPAWVVAVVDPCSDPRWAELVETEESDVFHSPAWMRVLRRAYGFSPRAALALDGDGTVQAGLAYCAVDGVEGQRCVSLPFSDFCDPVIRSADGWDAVVESMLGLGLPVVVRTRMAAIRTDSRFDEVKRNRWHGLELDRSRDALWDELHESARRAVRKARKLGVEVRPALSVSELRSFYEMHLSVRKHKYRLLAQPFEFFEGIWDEFHAVGDGSLLLARIDDEVIGGALFLSWKDRVYYKFNASTVGALAARPNDLVIWTAIEKAIDEGFGRLDFGLTDWDQESLARYKRKFGAVERDLVTLRSRSGEQGMDALRLSETLSRLTDLLTDESVPDDITEHASFLYRFFA